MQRFTPGHAQAATLANREVLDAVVVAQHPPVAEHDLALARR